MVAARGKGRLLPEEQDALSDAWQAPLPTGSARGLDGPGGERGGLPIGGPDSPGSHGTGGFRLRRRRATLVQVPAPDEIPAAPRPPQATRPPGRPIRVMRPAELAAILDLAVERALWPLLPGETPQWLTEMQRRLRLEFSTLVRERARILRGLTRRDVMTELERSRDRTLFARDEALAELEALRARRGAAVTQGDEPLELYERRIAKLNAALERAEAELAKATQGEPGFASSYRDVQGLDPDADRRDLRLALLGGIFAANRRLQGL